MDSILIVDDEPDVRELLQTVLNDLDYQVFSAASNEEAVKIFKHQKIDVLITDIILDCESENSESGIDTIMDFREQYPEAKIIAMSGGGGVVKDPGVLLDCAKNLGADMTLSKPFEIQDIFNAVEQLLGEQKNRENRTTLR